MFLSKAVIGKATGVVCQWVMLFVVSVIKGWLEMWGMCKCFDVAAAQNQPSTFHK